MAVPDETKSKKEARKMKLRILLAALLVGSIVAMSGAVLANPTDISKTCEESLEYSKYNRCWGWHTAHTYDLGQQYSISSVKGATIAGPSEDVGKQYTWHLRISTDGSTWATIPQSFTAIGAIKTSFGPISVNRKVRYVQIYAGSNNGFVDWSEVTLTPSQPELAEEGWIYQEPEEEVVGSVTTLWPWGFNYDGADGPISTWWWIRDSAFKDWAAWKFRVPPGLANASEVWLNFGLAVTNGVNGGQGYETDVRVTLKVLANGEVVEEQTHQVYLNNPFRPKDPQHSRGQGYLTYGLLRLPERKLQLLRSIGPGGILLVKVERKQESWDDGYQPHVAVQKEALLLRYR